MAEPHQRVQSGKLRAPGRRDINEYGGVPLEKIRSQSIGIQDAESIELKDSDDIIAHFYQTPTSLSNMHVDILTNIANESGITGNDIINKDWRNTWNIGTWCIGNQVSISINMMQPNIAQCWANVTCNIYEDMEAIVQKYDSYPLEKSVCTINGTSNPHQIKGRWTLHAVDEALSLGVIKRDPIDIGGINICQSQIFIWMLVGTDSEYLCTLTKDSTVLLAKYIPEWCLDIQEPTEAQNITLRLRDPSKTNDNSQLSITTTGCLQFNGRVDNAARLYGALSTALRDIMRSIRLKSFLESLHYESLPQDF